MRIVGSFCLKSQTVLLPPRYSFPLVHLHKLNLQDFCQNHLKLHKKLVPNRPEIDCDVGILEVAP